MAGVKGKSGGQRKNAGGARPGAGRKPKQPTPVPAKKSANAGAKKSANARAAAVKVSLEAQPGGGALKRTKSVPIEQEDKDMLTLLQDIALGRVPATALQVKAASAALPYTHAKKGEGGKKEERQQKAQAVAGRFAPSAPPRPRMN
ncbi:hypothetical protein ACL5HQ_13735 [Stenotrophomonas maltophilia]|uniref:hypothetical protein n=1 Tax=Stenotrophomonas maltophilia TaxID=40324 RepID=UPI0013DA5573|nr:hypothetical protein [Stenotrophomonas maltophilia]